MEHNISLLIGRGRAQEQGGLPSKFIWLNALALAAMAAGLALASLLPLGPSFDHTNTGAISIFFDGRWYRDIALHGYHWDPVSGVLPGHFQNAAFFPLYPLIERLFVAFTGTESEYALSFLSLLFGLWSNLAFSRFALKLLPEDSAFWASAFFICWPAASFLWMGYPTGLVNLCAIYGLWNYIDGKQFKAALWCGIGTAAAPTMVFVSAALCLFMASQWLKAGAPLPAVPKMIAFGLLSVSGLLMFMYYMAFKFHDAFVFEKAQDAWGKPPGFFLHLMNLFNIPRYFLVFAAADLVLNGVWHRHFLYSEHGRNAVNVVFQFLLGFLTVSFGSLVIFKAIYFRYDILIISSFMVILGYLWFMVTTDIYFLNGPRMCYPALALFIGLGGWLGKSHIKSSILLVSFVLLLVLETAMVKAGYVVI